MRTGPLDSIADAWPLAQTNARRRCLIELAIETAAPHCRLFSDTQLDAVHGVQFATDASLYASFVAHLALLRHESLADRRL